MFLLGLFAKYFALLTKYLPQTASILAIWEVLRAGFKHLKDRLPVRRVLGELRDANIPCLIFVKHLSSPAQDNQYVYKTPAIFPPHLDTTTELAINIPSVIAKADSTAISDVLNALGQAGRHEGIEIVDPAIQWDKWDASIICVGGSFKSEQAFKKCQPMPVIVDTGGFRITLTGERLRAVAIQDYGLIAKAKNFDNGRNVWIVMGLGTTGTEAAGYFLRTNLSALGRLFGKSPFSVVVQTTLLEGGRTAPVYWYTPEVALWRRLLYRKSFQRLARRREPPPSSAGLSRGNPDQPATAIRRPS